LSFPWPTFGQANSLQPNQPESLIMMKYMIWTGVAFLCLCSMALAGPLMTWDDCVRELIENNPELRAAQDNVEKVRADFKSNFSAFLPRIYGVGDAGKSKREADDGYSDSTSYGARITASQNIFEGFRNRAALNQSRALLISAQMDLMRVKSDLSYALRNSFSELLYAQDFLKLAEAIVARRKDNLNLVQLRFEAGRENKGSFLRSRALFHEAEYDVAKAHRSLIVAQRQLATTFGWYRDAVIKVTGKWDVAEPQETPNFIELIRTTPEHKKAVMQLETRKQAVTMARSEYYPSLSASASAGRQGDNFLPDKNHWSVGMTVSLPVFTGGNRFFSVQSARAEQRMAESGLINIDNELALTLKQSFAAWQDAIEQREVQAEFVHAAEVRAEIARSQYSNGMISFQDWDQIENDLIHQEKAILISRRNSLMAMAGWRKSIGTGVIP